MTRRGLRRWAIPIAIIILALYMTLWMAGAGPTLEPSPTSTSTGVRP